MTLRTTSAAALLLVVAFARPADMLSGQTRNATLERALTLGVSFHDVSGRLGSAAAVEVGYRSARRLFDTFRPGAGVMMAWDGAFYGFVGVSAPMTLPAGLTLTPSIGVGAFAAGARTDLGSVLEFRSAISLGVPGVATHPLDISFYHLSNAGIQRPNPGMEVLGISYALHW